MRQRKTGEKHSFRVECYVVASLWVIRYVFVLQLTNPENRSVRDIIRRVTVTHSSLTTHPIRRDAPNISRKLRLAQASSRISFPTICNEYRTYQEATMNASTASYVAPRAEDTRFAEVVSTAEEVLSYLTRGADVILLCAKAFDAVRMIAAEHFCGTTGRTETSDGGEQASNLLRDSARKCFRGEIKAHVYCFSSEFRLCSELKLSGSSPLSFHQQSKAYRSILLHPSGPVCNGTDEVICARTRNDKVGRRMIALKMSHAPRKGTKSILVEADVVCTHIY